MLMTFVWENVAGIDKVLKAGTSLLSIYSDNLLIYKYSRSLGGFFLANRFWGLERESKYK